MPKNKNKKPRQKRQRIANPRQGIMQAANRPALVVKSHANYFIHDNSPHYLHQFNLAVTLNTFPAQAGTAALFQMYRIRKIQVKAVVNLNVADQTSDINVQWLPVCYSYPVFDGNYPTMLA
jgi:hypothetical protein